MGITGRAASLAASASPNGPSGAAATAAAATAQGPCRRSPEGRVAVVTVAAGEGRGEAGVEAEPVGAPRPHRRPESVRRRLHQRLQLGRAPPRSMNTGATLSCQHLPVGEARLGLVGEREVIAAARPLGKGRVVGLQEAEGAVVHGAPAEEAVVGVEVALREAHAEPLAHQVRDALRRGPASPAPRRCSGAARRRRWHRWHPAAARGTPGRRRSPPCRAAAAWRPCRRRGR